MNKVVVSMCVLCYNKCQKHYNEVMNNKEYQTQRIKTWYENEKTNMINGIHEQPQRFAIQIGLNAKTSSANKIKKQIYRVKKICKKSEDHELDNIRRYFA